MIKKQSNIKIIDEEWKKIIKKIPPFIIKNKADYETAMTTLEKEGQIVLDLKSDIIAIENLLSYKEKGQVGILINSQEDLLRGMHILDIGPDVLLAPDEKIIKDCETVLPRKLKLEKAEIVDINVVPAFYRACLDSDYLMKEREGMLAGSFARGLFMIHSESLETEHVAPRPFRAHGGGVSNYVAMPDGSDLGTKYAGELNSGDFVIITDYNGNAKTIALNRNKMEFRQGLHIEAETDNDVLAVSMQDAETVYLTGPGGKARPVNELEKGEKVLVYMGLTKMMHGGKEVAEAYLHEH